MSKVSNDQMRKAIETVLAGAEEKKRDFVETIELQIGLKNYDPQKDKRFAGNIKLPHIPRPKMKVCVLGDAYHCEKAAAMGLEFKNAEGLKNFNKNKKLIKKFGAQPAPFARPRARRPCARSRTCRPLGLPAADTPATVSNAVAVAAWYPSHPLTLASSPPPPLHRAQPRSTTASSRRRA